MGGFFHSSTNQSFVLSAVSIGTQRMVLNLHPAFVHSPRPVFAKSFYPAVRPDDWCLGVIAVECVAGRNKFPFLLSELPQVPQQCVFNAKSDLVKAVLGYFVNTLLSEELVCVPPSQMMVQVSPHPLILHRVDTASAAFVGKLESWATWSFKRAVMPKETTSRVFCWVLHSHYERIP